jgi:hypothetical protein
MKTQLSLMTILLALAIATPSDANTRDLLKYAQAAPAPSDSAAPAAPPASAAPAAPPATAAPAAPPASAAPTAAPVSAAPAAPVRLVGLAAWSALVGNSISGMEDGKPLVEHYAANGTAKSMLGNEISSGTWALVGETVCFKYDSETECYRLEVIDNTATFTDAKAMELDTIFSRAIRRISRVLRYASLRARAV